MFTKSEKNVILFIIAVMVTGSIVGYLYPEADQMENSISPFPVNINTAKKEALKLLPGIGEIYAERIIHFRKEHNGFKKKEDLLEVKGIGIITFERIKKRITIGGYYDDN